MIEVRKIICQISTKRWKNICLPKFSQDKLFNPFEKNCQLFVIGHHHFYIFSYSSTKWSHASKKLQLWCYAIPSNDLGFGNDFAPSWHNLHFSTSSAKPAPTKILKIDIFEWIAEIWFRTNGKKIRSGPESSGSPWKAFSGWKKLLTVSIPLRWPWKRSWEQSMGS